MGEIVGVVSYHWVIYRNLFVVQSMLRAQFKPLS